MHHQPNLTNTFYSPKASYEKLQGISTVKPNSPNIMYVYGVEPRYEIRQEHKMDLRQDTLHYFPNRKKT